MTNPRYFPEWWPYPPHWAKKKRPTISATKRAKVYARDGFACVKCGTTDDLSLDHIVPRSKGGDDSLDNLQTMCRTHNTEKGDQ